MNIIDEAQDNKDSKINPLNETFYKTKSIKPLKVPEISPVIKDIASKGYSTENSID